MKRTAMFLALALLPGNLAHANDMPWIAVAKDKKSFVLEPSAARSSRPGASTTTTMTRGGSSKIIGSKNGTR